LTNKLEKTITAFFSRAVRERDLGKLFLYFHQETGVKFEWDSSKKSRINDVRLQAETFDIAIWGKAELNGYVLDFKGYSTRDNSIEGLHFHNGHAWETEEQIPRDAKLIMGYIQHAANEYFKKKEVKFRVGPAASSQIRSEPLSHHSQPVSPAPVDLSGRVEQILRYESIPIDP